MRLALQASLLDGDTGPALGVSPGVGPLHDMARTPLGRGAWVDHQPGWVRSADDVFGPMLTTVPWRAERRRMYDRMVDVPRLLAWYRAGDRLPHPVLGAAGSALGTYYAADLPEGFATVGLCLYRDGRDSVAWHGDTLGRGAREDTLVAIVSFGSPRALLLRPRGGGSTRRFLLGHGDLLVMGGSCQRTWEHAVPKTARPVGPRVSAQFRAAGVA
jgi:alkylated DNA repair dioxygenase AlkB